MAFLSGSEPINDGTSSVEVVFVTPFVSTPDVVIAQVANYVDGTILLLSSTAHIKSTTGFTVQLDAPVDSPDYVLQWMAGSSEIIFQALQTIGMFLHARPKLAALPADNDLIPLTVMSPLPTTKVFKWSLLKTAFANLVATPPTAPGSTGSFGQMAIDANYQYFHNGTVWIRIPLEQAGGSWAVNNAMVPTRKGVFALANGVQDQAVTFSPAFPSGSAPSVDVSVYNITDAATLMLSGVVIVANLAGFTVHLNAAPDSGNYKLKYTAEQLS